LPPVRPRPALTADTGTVATVDVGLTAAHVVEGIALQASGNPLTIFDPGQPGRVVAQRRGPFEGRRLELIALVPPLNGPYSVR
jgi:hypothetical protein